VPGVSVGICVRNSLIPAEVIQVLRLSSSLSSNPWQPLVIWECLQATMRAKVICWSVMTYRSKLTVLISHTPRIIPRPSGPVGFNLSMLGCPRADWPLSFTNQRFLFNYHLTNLLYVHPFDSSAIKKWIQRLWSDRDSYTRNVPQASYPLVMRRNWRKMHIKTNNLQFILIMWLAAHAFLDYCVD
jgi:hypothetical protein